MIYKDFYAPGNISVNADYKVYAIRSWVGTTITITVGSTTVERHEAAASFTTKTDQLINSSASATFTNSARRVSVDCSYGGGITGAEVYYINLTYKK